MVNWVAQYTNQSEGDASNLHLAAAKNLGNGVFVGDVVQPDIFRYLIQAVGQVVRQDFRQLTGEEIQARIDPVVGIHPGGLSFEGFSRDGSVMAFVHFDDQVFGNITKREAGCTNIDYSDEIDRFLSRHPPRQPIHLSITTSRGIRLSNVHERHREKKISLPDDWVAGFGELHASLAQSELCVPLTRTDLANILHILHTRADLKSEKRAMVFELAPGEPTVVRFEPWEKRIKLHGTPPEIEEPAEIRVYGRRRLYLLQNILRYMRAGAIYLSGDARPSHWLLEFDGAHLIFSMSAWTGRKFTKHAIEVLTGPHAAVNDELLRRAALALADAERLRYEELADELGIDTRAARAVVIGLCRQGLAVSEPWAEAVQWRPAMQFPLAELSAAGVSSTREEGAMDLLQSGALDVGSMLQNKGLIRADACCRGSAGVYTLRISLEPDGSFLEGECSCAWMRRQNQSLRSGPCKHLLALRERVIQLNGRNKADE